MKTSIKGKEFIVKHEGGHILKAYICPAGVPTIGAGLTFYPDGSKVSITDEITQQEASNYFSGVLRKFEDVVNKLVYVKLTQNQFDALVSFCYNIGPANFKRSTLLKKVNIDPFDENIGFQFLRWNRAGGRVLKGLTKRRQQEKMLYFNGVY